MRFASTFLLTASLLTSACGGIAVFDDGGSGGDTGFTSQSGPTSGTRATSRTSGVNAATSATRASSVNAVGSGSYGPSGPNMASWTIDVGFSGNCQPVVGTDPVAGSVTLRYDTIYATDNLRITEAFITSYDVNGNQTGRYPIFFAPDETGDVVPGSPVTVTHTKVGSQGDLSPLCAECGSSLGVELHYENGGSHENSFDLGCAF